MENPDTSLDNAQVSTSPTNVQPTSAEAVTSAETATPAENIQTDDNALKDLVKLQNTVHEHEKSGLKAGEALYIIKKDKLYRKSQEYAGCTWKEYTPREFGFTPQYANRLIYAWCAYNSTKKQFESENRGEEFEKLPKTASFWAQFSRFPQELQKRVFEDLYDGNKELKSDWKHIYYNVVEKQMAHSTEEPLNKQKGQKKCTLSSEGKQTETPDMAAQCNDDTPDEQDSYEDNSPSNERITKLAKEIFQAIEDDGDLLMELSTFTESDMASFVEALLQESTKFMMNNRDEEAE